MHWRAKHGVPAPGDSTSDLPVQILYRDATGNDVEAIARLHADSWRRHYRGAFLDSFLDGDVLPERIAVWRGRLHDRDRPDITVVADLQNSVVGFLHMILDEHPRWGTLLDNLHVVWHLKRRGIARRLMQESAQRLLRHDRRNFYLWVLDQNAAAQNFYLTQGGIRVETCLRGPFPGGGHALGHRIAWPDAAGLGALNSMKSEYRDRQGISERRSSSIQPPTGNARFCKTVFEPFHDNLRCGR